MTLDAGNSLAPLIGSSPVAVCFDEGWGARSLTTEDGNRQIVKFLLPGDCLWPAPPDMEETDVVALTRVRLRIVSLEGWYRMEAVSPADLARRLAMVAAAAQMRLIDHIQVLGGRSGRAKVVRLLLDLGTRAAALNGQGPRLSLPLTRTVLADALGMTERHVSRVLKELEVSAALSLERGLVTVDLTVLAEAAAAEA